VIPERDQPQLRLLTRGAEQASAEEVAANPRAASVRLRAVERIKEAA
jgi:16S rRNA (cytosine1402-N4)-methyltransferase